MKLVIIEGPGKRDTIKKYLGKDYDVFATKGHIRDLPVRTLGVDIENNFTPKYEPMPEKKEVIKTLKDKAGKADEILIATDMDREGEAIGWHIAHILGLNPHDNIRIEFNEISKNAVQRALAAPRSIDHKLVDAQQARRVLDRIVGYKLSPIISRKIQPKLSAGRVQSVVLKLVVDREREILNFKPEEWWAITANLAKLTHADLAFDASLNAKDGKKLKVANAEQKDAVLRDIEGGKWVVGKIKKSVTRSHAPAPYITSSMQQDALNRLGMNLKRTSSAAQNLYEGVEVEGRGKIALITYIRTDSVRISPEAQSMAKEFILSNYGEKYYPSTPNFYKSKKSAQDGHEAIRPIDLSVRPADVKASLSQDNYKLYKLIYERFLASQMAEATYNSVAVDVVVNGYNFHATGRTPIFDGYTRVMQDAPSEKDAENHVKIPELTEGEELKLNKLTPEQKFTKPPARYTEASLVKAMEERGIGRPATYTPTILILFNRTYTEKDGKYIKPTELGCTVADTLVKHFPDIMDVAFTARMEDQLDEVAEGREAWQQLLDGFYGKFEQDLKAAAKEMIVPPEETDEICDKCGSKMVIRTGRYGKFLACSNYPKCKNIKNLPGQEGNKENKAAPEETDEVCDKCGAKMVVRNGKYGKFLACSNYPDCKNIKNLAPALCKCPVCGKDVIERVSKKGKKFYGCTGYPDCKFVSWYPPTNEKCLNCDGMLFKKETKSSVTYFCNNDKCGYKRVEKVKENKDEQDE